MPQCRIYLFTYKRNHLLPRAVQSIIDQTFQDWICEVHNDSPGDEFPDNYIQSLNDKRFTIHNHPVNMGAVASFNLAFAGCGETYASLLEDDNWWEPSFLAEMIGLMDKKQDLNIAWSNMRTWKEEAENVWEDTGNTIWPSGKDKLFSWPQPQQLLAALHSNGAMIYRGGKAHEYIIPAKTLFNAVELVRERSFEHPIFLNSKPLANFAVTLSTSRIGNAYDWIASQVMLLASFIGTSGNDATVFKNNLAYYRNQKPTPVANFWLANYFILKDKQLYHLFNLSDWFAIGKWLVKNGHKLNYMKSYLESHADVYQYLLEKTQRRYDEAKENP